MSYLFSHHTVNGTVVTEREFALTMNKNVELISHYQETKMSVKIRNDEAQNQIIVKTTVIEAEITIAPGDTAEIPYNPDTDVLILKPTP